MLSRPPPVLLSSHDSIPSQIDGHSLDNPLAFFIAVFLCAYLANVVPSLFLSRPYSRVTHFLVAFIFTVVFCAFSAERSATPYSLNSDLCANFFERDFSSRIKIGVVRDLFR